MQIQEKDSRTIGWYPSRDELNKWLQTQPLCTLSSLDRTGAPESATVAFSVTQTGELLVGTAADSRKSKNIDYDERVAVTVTDPEARLTAQIKGLGHKLVQTAFLHAYAKEHYRQRPESLPFRDEPSQAHILISPHYIKFTDANPHPWVVTEFTG